MAKSKVSKSKYPWKAKGKGDTYYTGVFSSKSGAEYYAGKSGKVKKRRSSTDY